MTDLERETRLEYMRPAQLNSEMERCPLVFLPTGPLEYHGPHLPVGVDAINATFCAAEACRRLGKGVVHPTLYFGTERERPDPVLESLGFKAGDWVVGMDFPTTQWRSHYYSEQAFAMLISAVLEMLISRGYRVIVIVNGHGAKNQLQTLDRLCAHYTHTTGTLVLYKMAFALPEEEKGRMGHADLYETSLILHYQEKLPGRPRLVDIGALPDRTQPIHYADFSIVDGPGFGSNPHPQKIVEADPRDASEEKGQRLFDGTVRMLVESTRDALRCRNLG